jgi:hypothetical protein
MVQIQVTGPEHSGKGYIMVAIAHALRQLGAEVQVQGEATHLVNKTVLTDEAIHTRLDGQIIRLTELKTGI